MESRTALMEKVLAGLLENVKEIGEQIKAKGVVPKEVCELCNVENKRHIVDFTTEEKKSVEQLRDWIQDFNIIAISQNLMNEIYIKTTRSSTLLAELTSVARDEKGFIFHLNKNIKNYPKIRSFLLKYKGIKSCPHFEEHPDNILKIESCMKSDIRVDTMEDIPRELFSKVTTNRLFFCCNECKGLIENTMCDGVNKHGFLYDYECPLQDIELKRRLNLNGLKYEDLKEEENQSIWSMSGRIFYFLPENSIVISQQSRWTSAARDVDNLSDFTKYLHPTLIVVFDSSTNLPSYMKLDTNIFFYTEEGMFFYDKNRKIEEDLNKICEKIVSSLNVYVDKERGAEHDRVISALCSIGQDLGYVPQKEYGKSAVRIDCVWFDRKGKIQIASEVETSSTWKKDLISTWEVEPKLAIIVSFQNTDNTAKSLMKLSLMKYVPHNVLYINKQTDNAYLFEKQEIVKHYELNREEIENSKTLRHV